jgi:hypothetical protein
MVLHPLQKMRTPPLVDICNSNSGYVRIDEWESGRFSPPVSKTTFFSSELEADLIT